MAIAFKRSTVLATLAMILTVLVMGGAKAQGAPIVLFTGTGHAFSNIFVADTLGYFEDEGLDVRVITFTSGSEAIEAFRAGGAQFVASGDLAGMRLWERGDAIGVMTIENDLDRMVIVTQSDITEPEDFRGKTIATRIGSTGEFLTLKYLNEHGVSEDEVDILNLSPPDMVVALEGGAVDAFVIWQPYGWQAEDVSGDKVHILTTGRGYVQEFMLLSVTREFEASNPDAVRSVVRALHRASEWMESASLDEQADLVADYTKDDWELTRQIMEIMEFGVSLDNQFKREMEALWSFMAGQGVLGGQVDWDANFNADYVRDVAPELVTAF